MSLTATMLMSLSPSEVRYKLRPMRPKPLMPTLMPIIAPPCKLISILCERHVFHLHVYPWAGFDSELPVLFDSVSKIHAHAGGPVWVPENPTIAAHDLGSCGFSRRSKSRGKARRTAAP